MSDQLNRHRVERKWFVAENRAKFNKTFRHASAITARKKRDEETRRMEEYRRLCKKEGISSTRLAEYDARKNQFNAAMDEELKNIECDSNLSKADKRRKIFSIKRKAATRSETLNSTTTGISPITKKIEHIRKKKEESEQERAELRRAREEQKKEASSRRSRMNSLYAQRTTRGQPVMRSRMQALLSRIEKSTL